MRFIPFLLALGGLAGFGQAGDFVVSYWDGPPPAYTTLDRYREIKEANFTVAFPAHGTMTVEQNRALLDHSQKLGLKGVIADPRMPKSIAGDATARQRLDAIVADYSQHPALMAYFVVDEPSAGQFDGLAEVVAYLKEKDPKHPGFINLFPVHADPATQLGVATYDEYLEQYLTKVKPFVLSYDHYHFTNSGDGPHFYRNLALARNAAIKHGVPFWNICLLLQHYDYRHLTEAEIRFEAMQTLAFGAKGLLWYTYWYPGPLVPTVAHALINHDGSKDPHYDMVKRVNGEARALGNELTDAQSWATFHSGDGGEFLPPPECPVTPGAGKLTIGLFRHTDGHWMTLVANRDYRKGTETSLTILKPSTRIERFDIATSHWVPATSPVPLTLPAGGAVLLRW